MEASERQPDPPAADGDGARVAALPPDDPRAARRDFVFRARPVPRTPRYRRRLGAGLAMLVLAAAGSVWAVWGALAVGQTDPAGARRIDLDDVMRAALRSILVIVLCAGTILCATHPIRRAREDFARLAVAEIAVAGALLLAMVVTYWLAWSPMTFLN